MFNRCRDCADAGFIPAFLGALNRFSSRAVRPAQASRASQSPHIVVGITSAQTCLVLQGRLRVLREAGFRVTLVSSPAICLHARPPRKALNRSLSRTSASFASLASKNDEINATAIARSFEQFASDDCASSAIVEGKRVFKLQLLIGARSLCETAPMSSANEIRSCCAMEVGCESRGRRRCRRSCRTEPCIEFRNSTSIRAWSAWIRHSPFPRACMDVRQNS